MIIGQRLREIREAKNLSQDNIEQSTGLVRPYISRVENGHTIPSVGTLQKWEGALGMQLYQVLYEGEEPPKPPKTPGKVDEKLWGNSGREARQLDRLQHFLAKMPETDRNALIAFAAHLARASAGVRPPESLSHCSILGTSTRWQVGSSKPLQ